MTVFCDALPFTEWKIAPPDYRVAGAIAVFRVPIAESSRYLPRGQAVLHPAELLRAGRYHQPADRTRFLVARAALRWLLGAYARRPPASLILALGPNKKPVLQDAPGLHYNVSHAGNWVLIAIAGTEIGVDVEKVAAQFAFQDVLGTSFSPAEQAFIGQGAASAPLFYQLWTRKEALVKATAQGIDANFWQVPALDGLHELAGPGGAAGPGWAVSSFAVADGYAAAVAYPAALRGQLTFHDVDALLFS
ncbi:MAG: 4'-phosphopantetheinyl transferase superfamily protein [Cytophagaceae bacterium]|nr:MAG: 4'-phosphopantetheinyl transferase superfamily protein [Cytophagaceae bacterium]